MKFNSIVILLLTIFLATFIFGCSHIAETEKQSEEKTIVGSEEKNQTEGVKEVGLGNLCSSFNECVGFCQKNQAECINFCLKNPSNQMCNLLKEAEPSGGASSQRESFAVNLPECAGQTFTISPVNFNNIYEIVPLGNLNPPDHTLPTEHIYFWLGEEPPVSSVQIKSPGDVYLIQIQTTKYLQEGRADYGLTFALCKDIYGYFLHIQELALEFQTLVSEQDCRNEGKYAYCNTQLNQKISAGTILGKVGGQNTHSFDFGAYDYRVKHEYANPSRYTSKSPNVVCPLDLYSAEIKSKLYSKVKRTAEPRCGTSAQDVKGTLKGTWFFGDATAEQPSDWHKHLAFVQYNFDPSQAAISVGGIFMESGYWTFTPTHTGLINREFSEVASDGNIYCYSGGLLHGQGESMPGKIILQLVSATEIKIEQQSGGCSSNFAFKNPAIYIR